MWNGLSFSWEGFFFCIWYQWLFVLMNETERGQRSCCVRDRVCVCVCTRMHAVVCLSVVLCSLVCMARIDTQTGLISRDLWALTGCRLVSTATSKGWRCFTYPDGELHPRTQRHIAHRGSRASRCWEVPVWSWEWKRGQHPISVARCLWWVHEICCKISKEINEMCGNLIVQWGEIWSRKCDLSVILVLNFSSHKITDSSFQTEHPRSNLTF